MEPELFQERLSDFQLYFGTTHHYILQHIHGIMLIKKFEKTILERNPGIFEYYNAGLEETNVINTLERVKLNPIHEMVALYSWHNGLKASELPTTLTSIFPYGVFVPVEFAIKGYLELTKLKLIPLGLFPLLLDDDILINLDNKSPDFGYLFIRSPSLTIIKPEKIFISLEIFIKTVTECYQKEVIKFNAQKMRQIDFKRMAEISKELNPGCSYWTKR